MTAFSENTQSERHAAQDRSPVVMAFHDLKADGIADFTQMVRGEGVFVFDDQGKDYLEASSAFYCASLGFSNPDLIKAMHAQAKDLAFYVTGAGRLPCVTVELASRLVEIAPLEDARVSFASTGSEANDFLIKLLRLRARWRGDGDRSKVLVRRSSYHGGTIATASMTRLASENREFGLPLEGYLGLRQPDFAREGHHGEIESDFVARLVREAEELILAEGPDTVLAFVAEPVSYSAGIVLPPRDYFPKMQAMLHRYGIVCVADEVVTGFGRLGEFFAAPQYGFAPDCITIAKGFSGAHFPIAACLLSGPVYEDVRKAAIAARGFAHGSTFAGHPVGAAIALEVIRQLGQEGFLRQVQDKSKTLCAKAQSYLHHDAVCAVRCAGLSVAVEFSLGDTEASRRFVSHLSKTAFENGLIMRAAGTSVLFVPPLIISDEEIEEMFRRFDAALSVSFARWNATQENNQS